MNFLTHPAHWMHGLLYVVQYASSLKCLLPSPTPLRSSLAQYTFVKSHTTGTLVYIHFFIVRYQFESRAMLCVCGLCMYATHYKITSRHPILLSISIYIYWIMRIMLWGGKWFAFMHLNKHRLSRKYGRSLSHFHYIIIYRTHIRFITGSKVQAVDTSYRNHVARHTLSTWINTYVRYCVIKCEQTEKDRKQLANYWFFFVRSFLCHVVVSESKGKIPSWEIDLCFGDDKTMGFCIEFNNIMEI